MRGLLLLAAIGGTALALVWVLVASRRVDETVPMAPCDSCGRMTSARDAHTHHHEPECGTDRRPAESCSCNFYLCPACCPCDIAALLEVRHG